MWEITETTRRKHRGTKPDFGGALPVQSSVRILSWTSKELAVDLRVIQSGGIKFRLFKKVSLSLSLCSGLFKTDKGIGSAGMKLYSLERQCESKQLIKRLPPTSVCREECLNCYLLGPLRPPGMARHGHHLHCRFLLPLPLCLDQHPETTTTAQPGPTQPGLSGNENRGKHRQNNNNKNRPLERQTEKKSVKDRVMFISYNIRTHSETGRIPSELIQYQMLILFFIHCNIFCYGVCSNEHNTVSVKNMFK
uniref:uncharacterized protein LOC124015098 n=1 Tax=Oncorhynchus gorbuscha TaxID=8017 RepID=UPI001EAEDB44|nr:uncharacterized protein LOC124015098 [Oncorhynchus gorbuscha]